MFAPGQEVYYNSVLGKKKVFGIVATEKEIQRRYRDQPVVLERIRRGYPEGVVFAHWNESRQISYMPTGSVFPSHKNYSPEQSGDTDDDI